MAADICPTITAADEESYRLQMERIAPFVLRVHIDIADGTLTPNSLMSPSAIWWPGGVRADLHVMSKRPLEHLETLVALRPQLIIVHAEADGDFEYFAGHLHSHGIETGVALTPSMRPEMLRSGISHIDHVLLFSGDHLGSFGGTADFALLNKVAELKKLKPSLEIGWDGGVNRDTAARLAAGGIEVLNSGGFIHHADNPHQAFQQLHEAIGL